MTECNGCGRCCDPYTSIVSPLHLRTGFAEQVVGDETADWMRAHLTPLKRRDGIEMTADYLDSGMTMFVVAGHVVQMLTWFYKCDLYDSETRQCTDHSSRPAPCRGFPWFGEEPTPTKALPVECSFNADVGRPVVIRPRP